ncbi:MAG: LacI family DNA-binding transcriptional regulator [Burkholderiaceae bacterium]
MVTRGAACTEAGAVSDRNADTTSAKPPAIALFISVSSLDCKRLQCRLRVHRRECQCRSPYPFETVARAAGVSTSTVSRVLSAPELVNAHTRERVEGVIARLGYLPHGAARALARKRSGSVGAVIPRLGCRCSRIRCRRCSRPCTPPATSYCFRPWNGGPATRLTICADSSRTADGVALLGSEHSPEVYALLESLHLPFICVWASDEKRRGLPCAGLTTQRRSGSWPST